MGAAAAGAIIWLAEEFGMTGYELGIFLLVILSLDRYLFPVIMLFEKLVGIVFLVEDFRFCVKVDRSGKEDLLGVGNEGKAFFGCFIDEMEFRVGGGIIAEDDVPDENVPVESYGFVGGAFFDKSVPGSLDGFQIKKSKHEDSHDNKRQGAYYLAVALIPFQ